MYGPIIARACAHGRLISSFERKQAGTGKFVHVAVRVGVGALIVIWDGGAENTECTLVTELDTTLDESSG